VHDQQGSIQIIHKSVVHHELCLTLVSEIDDDRLPPPTRCLPELSLTSGTGEGHRSSALPTTDQSQEARTMYSEFIHARVM